jgi:ribonuclease HI
MSYYSVANGKTIGVFLNWNDCNNSVKGYKNALYKKFNTREEADNFIKTNNKNINDDINNDDKNTTQKSIKSFFNKTDNEKEKDLDFIPDYYVYTDGACSNNGKSNASAGIGIYFGINDIRNLSKKIDGNQTNNAAELTAIIETHFIIENDIKNGKKVAIVTDSEYAIKCVSSYGEKCYKKSWNLDMPNKELVKTAYELYKNKPNVQFIHIMAHTNNVDIHSVGNDNADKLANLSIGLDSCPYDSPTKIYLIVPFIKKDEIKKMGGMWDSNKKKWFINDNNLNKELILENYKMDV